MPERKQPPAGADAAEEARNLALPAAVTGPTDLGGLIRELAAIDEAMLQIGLRKGELEAKLPKTGKLMDQTVHVNRLNLLKQSDRAALKTFLEAVKKNAPVLHISFSADPPPAFLDKLVAWFRREIHPSAMLSVGLQPNIGAGCILRTANRQFDLSLRQDFTDKRGLLLERLAAKTPAPASPPVPAPPAGQGAPS